MHKETKATKIPKAVKDAVRRRDDGYCILCGRPGGPHCHVTRRAAGGMGVEQNIVTLCDDCHRAFDEGRDDRQEIKAFIYAYMRQHYPGWTPESVTYHKWI